MKTPTSPTEEALYNGIELPSPWPPRREEWPNEPTPTPYYIVSPPKVIPIDIGRQLFVDNFLIEETTLKRTYHAAEYESGNPVFTRGFPYSDGIWYDPQDKLFKMWYFGGAAQTRYAISQDGIKWELPSLDVVPGTNIVHPPPEARRDSNTVWLDLEEKDPQRRYKLFCYLKGPEHNICSVHFSPDGIHWSDIVARTGRCGDTSSVFWNPFRRVWVYSAKDPHVPPRQETYMVPTGNLKGRDQRIKRRMYWEVRDLVNDPYWTDESLLNWIGADKLDPMRPDLNIQTMLYRLDCVAYESLILGLFTIWHGQHDARPKINDLVANFSRDGFNWDRTNREPLVTVSEKFGDWNWANVSSVGGCCLIVGDKLRFYVNGRSGVKGTPEEGKISTGIATLRRDGFASMDAGESEGTLTTSPVSFKGKYMYVNVDCPKGELRVEVLDENGAVIQPFSRVNCVPVSADKTIKAATWKGADDLSSLSGKPVKFRFHLRNGKLYSFWISPDESGASHGYVAAGGPGFTGPTDNVRSAANG